MNNKEFVLLSLMIFLGMVALMVNEIYHIQNSSALNREIKPIEIPKASVDESIFPILSSRDL